MLAPSLGLEVWQLARWHVRIVGKQLVDFWPSTGRGWIVGSPLGAREMTVQEVCDLAIEGFEILPEAAADHMKSLH